MPFRELKLTYTETLAGRYDLGVQLGRGTKDLIDKSLPLDTTLTVLVKAVKESHIYTSRMKMYQSFCLELTQRSSRNSGE